MEESSNRRGGGIIVVVLVLMALASLQGVSSLVSDNTDPTRGEGSAPEPEAQVAGGAEPTSDPMDELLPSPESSPSSSPEPENGVDVAGRRLLRVVRSYPKACLGRRVGGPSPGKLAAFQGGMVSIVTPGSDSVVRIEARKPISWSPSGKFLATGDGDLFRSDGSRAGTLSKDGSTLWAWAPGKDCGVAVTDSGMTVYGHRFGERKLFDAEGIEDISFSPDGRKLAFVVHESERRRTIWVADLERGFARLGEVVIRRTPMLEVLGWTSDSHRVLYVLAAGEAFAADGLPLRFLNPRRKEAGKTGLTVMPDDSFITHCAGRELIVAGGGLKSNADKRLAYLTTSGPSFITPTSAAVVSPACSPDGSYIAAVASGNGEDISARRLALLRSGGSFERFLAPEGSGDEYPVWGPRGTGLSFIRIRPSGRMADVWFIPEGGSARPTVLAVAVPPESHGSYDWAQVFDWSATP